MLMEELFSTYNDTLGYVYRHEGPFSYWFANTGDEIYNQLMKTFRSAVWWVFTAIQ